MNEHDDPHLSSRVVNPGWVTPMDLLASAMHTLGEGGMARVLLATDPLLRRKVALKVQKDLTGSTDSRFISEAQILAQLQHPGLVPVYQLAQMPGGGWFYAMRPVQGETLSDVLNRLRKRDPQTTSRYTVPRLIALFQRVCETVHYAHRCGVIHRDLKPGNIMLDQYGAVLVMDWGLAKVLGHALGGPSRAEQEAPAGPAPAVVPLTAGEGPQPERHDVTADLMHSRSQALGVALGDDTSSAEPAPPTDPVGAVVLSADATPPTADPDSLSAPHLAVSVQETTVLTELPVAGKAMDLSASAIQRRTVAKFGGGPPRAAVVPVPPPPAADAAPAVLPAHDGPAVVSVGTPEQTFAPDLTAEGVTVGSPAYMSPEQMQHLPDLDHRTDIYALGATLYEMLTLCRPHTAATLQFLLDAKLAGVQHPSAVAPHRHIPDVLARVAMRCLAPEPRERFSSVAEIIDLLDDFLVGTTVWKLLRDDHFTGGAMPAGWKSRSGTWRSGEGGLSQVDPDAEAEMILVPALTGGVKLQVEARVPPGRVGGIGLMLAYAIRRPHAYVFRFGTDWQGHSTLSKGHAIVASSPVAPEIGQWYEVTAERQDDVLRLSVNGQEVLEYVDEDPLKQGHVGLCCYGAGLEVRRAQVWVAGQAQKVSCLAVPDALREVQEYEPALAAYDRIAADLDQEREGGRASYRAGLCELELDRLDAAQARFEGLTGTRWAQYGYIGLAAVAARRGDWTSEITGLKNAVKQTGGEIQQAVLAELEQRAWHYHEFLAHQPAAYAANLALVEVRPGGLRGLDVPTALRVMDVAFGQQDWNLVRQASAHLVQRSDLPDTQVHALATAAQADYWSGRPADAVEKLDRARRYRDAVPVVWQIRRLQWLAMLGQYDRLPRLITALMPHLATKVYHADELWQRCNRVLHSLLVLPDTAQRELLLHQLHGRFGRSRRIEAHIQAAHALSRYWQGDTATAESLARQAQGEHRTVFDYFLPVPLFLAAQTGQHRLVDRWVEQFVARHERPYDLQPVVARLIQQTDASPKTTQRLLDPVDWRCRQRVAATLGELASIEGQPTVAIRWFDECLRTQAGSRLFPAPWASERYRTLTGHRIALAADPDVPPALLDD